MKLDVGKLASKHVSALRECHHNKVSVFLTNYFTMVRKSSATAVKKEPDEANDYPIS